MDADIHHLALNDKLVSDQQVFADIGIKSYWQFPNTLYVHAHTNVNRVEFKNASFIKEGMCKNINGACSECGNKLKKKWIYCSKCGHKIEN